MATTQKRGKALKILMTEGTHARLMVLSEALGQAPATLASVAVSEYVNRMSVQLAVGEKAVQAMVDHIGPEFSAQLKLMGAS